MVGAENHSDAQRAYINICIYTYHALLGAGNKHRNDLQKVRALLKKEKEDFSLLGKKRSLMAQLITTVPFLYKPGYWFYNRFFQKSVYS